MTNGPWFSKA